MLFHRWLHTALMCLLGTLGSAVHADDWPRFRGPHLNGVSLEKGLNWQWPANGPKQLWKASVGQGFSSVSVVGNKLLTIGSEGDTATIYCLDAITGKELWKKSYAEPLNPKYYEGGASSTPTIEGEMAYVLGRQGDVFALWLNTGAVQWHKNIAQELGAKVPEWGFAGSPLIDGRALILNLGSAGVAVNRQNGKVLWASTNGPAGYASPIPYNPSQNRPALIFSQKQLAAVDMKNGKELWSFPFETEYDTNIADPVIYGGRIFLSSHSKSGLLLKVLDGKPEVVWHSADTKVHINAGVVFRDYLYVFNGLAGKPGDLRCLDLRNGEVKWKQDGLGVGSLTAADGKLVILSEKGELVVAEPAADGFKPIARAQVLGGKCWTAPVVANGRIYCRNSKGDLVCVDVNR
jgi:outer membrane protein assembly factor BamB